MIEINFSITSDGKLSLPDQSGLGLKLDEEWISYHKVATLD